MLKYFILALVASATALDCCVYSPLDDPACQPVCVWEFSECPYFENCTLLQQYAANRCMEPEGCVYNPFLEGSRMGLSSDDTVSARSMPKSFVGEKRVEL